VQVAQEEEEKCDERRQRQRRPGQGSRVAPDRAQAKIAADQQPAGDKRAELPLAEELCWQTGDRL